MTTRHLRLTPLLTLAAVTLAATAALAEPAHPYYQNYLARDTTEGTPGAQPMVVAAAHPYDQNYLALGTTQETSSAQPMLMAEARPYDQNYATQESDSMQPTAEFTPAAAPMVSAVQPQSGEEGILVRIQGSNLSGVTEVQFSDGRNASFKVVGDNELRAVVPEGARPGPIALVSPDSVVKTPVPFTVAYE